MKERPILFSSEMVRAILDGRKTQTRRPVNPQPPKNALNGVLCWPTGGEGMPKSWIGKFGYMYEVPSVGGHTESKFITSPYGGPGDRLWVRETWRVYAIYPGEPIEIEFKADMKHAPVDEAATEEWEMKIWDQTVEELKRFGCSCEENTEYDISNYPSFKWRPSIHMPRWACRTILEIVDVRMETIQDILRDEAFAEGIEVVDPYEYAEECRPLRYFAYFKDYLDQNNFVSDPIVSFQTLWDSIYSKKQFSFSDNGLVWVYDFKKLEPTHAE